MSGQEPVTRGTVFYWMGMVALWIVIISLSWYFFRPPEQFGRVVIESLWCGVPVIGSDSGEIPWLIELTGGGLVFPEGDRDALAGRLRELRADPDRRRALAAAGRASVERLFSVPAATDALERMLERAAATSGS